MGRGGKAIAGFACPGQEFEIRNVELEMVCLPAAGLRKAKGGKGREGEAIAERINLQD